MGRIILVLSFIMVNLFGMNYEINKGWNLLGSNENLEVNNSNFLISWKFKDGKWYFYTKNDNLNKIAKKYGYGIFDKINAEEGFWVYSNKDMNISIKGQKEKCQNIDINNSWQLVSFCENIDTKFLDKFKNILVWKYKNNEWYGYSTDNNIKNKIKEKYNLLSNININEGVWIKGNKANLNTNFYNVYYFYLDNNNSIMPLSNVNVYDKNNNLIAKTDNKGRITLNSTNKILHLNYNKFANTPLVLDSKIANYVKLVTKKEKLVKTKISKLFDIGNYRLGGTNLFLEEKIPPKGFFSFDNKYGFIVKKFYIKEDTTISVEEVNESNSSIIGACQVKLENSLGEPISIKEDKFTGQFKIFVKTKKINGNVALMLKKDNKFEYLTPCIYLNGKYVAQKYVDKIGEYVFVKRPLLYSHNIKLNVDKAIIFDSNFNPHIIYKNGSFSTLNKEENVTVFASDYYPLKTTLTNDNNISLQKMKFKNYCFNVSSALNNEALNTQFTAKVYNKIYNITSSLGEFCINSDKNISKLNINGIDYYMNDNNLSIFKVYKEIDSNALTYSDLIDNNGSLMFVYNTIAGAKALDLENNKNYSLENFYFNAYSSNLLGDLADNIYYDSNKTSFSKDDFFDDIGYFVNPFVKSNYVYVPTTTAKIILLNKNGTNPYMSPIYLKTYDTNKTNDLVYLNDFNDTDLIAIVNEGLVYDVNKSTQNVKLLYKADNSLNFYEFAKYQNKFLVIEKGNLIDVFSKKVLFKDVQKVLTNKDILAIENNKKISIYKNNKKLYNLSGDLIKLLLNNKDIFIITQHKIYKNNLLVAEFKADILNASFKKGYFLVEFNNGKNLILK